MQWHSMHRCEVNLMTGQSNAIYNNVLQSETATQQRANLGVLKQVMSLSFRKKTASDFRPIPGIRSNHKLLSSEVSGRADQAVPRHIVFTTSHTDFECILFFPFLNRRLELLRKLSCLYFFVVYILHHN
jgi:hypothetical protein